MILAEGANHGKEKRALRPIIWGMDNKHWKYNGNFQAMILPHWNCINKTGSAVTEKDMFLEKKSAMTQQA